MALTTWSDMQHTRQFWFEPNQEKKFSGIQVCVISSFDGLHQQHRNLLDYAIGKTENNNPSEVLIVIIDHPIPEQKLLLSFDQRLRLIQSLVSDRFNFIRLDLSGDPVNKIYDTKVPIRLLVPGNDFFTYYHNHRGAVSILETAEKKKIPVDRHFDSEAIDQSILIRDALSKGNVALANEMLGYAYFMRGRVTEGNMIGRTLGYPTANLKPLSPDKIIPNQGVYAAMVNFGNRWYQSMVNIGIRPTLDLKNLTIEANLFHFDQDIYGQELTIHFIYRTRNEMRFSSLAELKQQLDIDHQITAGKLQEFVTKYYPKDDHLVLNK